MLSTREKISAELTKYENALAQRALPFESYRLYLLNFRALKRLEEEYDTHFKCFMQLMMIIDDVQVEYFAERMNKIHQKFHHLFVDIYRANIRKKEINGRSSNRNGGKLRLIKTHKNAIYTPLPEEKCPA